MPQHVVNVVTVNRIREVELIGHATIVLPLAPLAATSDLSYCLCRCTWPHANPAAASVLRRKTRRQSHRGRADGLDLCAVPARRRTDAGPYVGSHGPASIIASQPGGHIYRVCDSGLRESTLACLFVSNYRRFDSREPVTRPSLYLRCDQARGAGEIIRADWHCVRTR